MSVLAIRHGLSEANNRASLAFASEMAPLMAQGREQAELMGLEVTLSQEVDLNDPTAVSQLRRSQETAEVAGFTNRIIRPSINEVILKDWELRDLRESLDAGWLPHAAILQAEAILENPPEEGIWITHGLVIAGLCAVLGVHQSQRLVPRFCEIRELPIAVPASPLVKAHFL